MDMLTYFFAASCGEYDPQRLKVVFEPAVTFLYESTREDKLINGSKKVLITDVVLAETIWTLKGKKYNLDKEGIIRVVNALFQEPNICFEDGQVVWCSLNDYRKAKGIKVGNTKKQADFPDALIANKSKSYVLINGDAFDGYYTFDIAAHALPNAKKP